MPAPAEKALSQVGFRRIAADLARPAETVRGWLRRFAERAEAVRSVFTVMLRAVDPDPVMPDAAVGVFAYAVTVIAAAPGPQPTTATRPSSRLTTAA